MAWEDNFNPIFTEVLPQEDGKKEWRFTLEEHKTKGKMQMNIRLFSKAVTEGGYEGPTKNGFIQGVNSEEDVNKLQSSFNAYFEKVKTML